MRRLNFFHKELIETVKICASKNIIRLYKTNRTTFILYFMVIRVQCCNKRFIYCTNKLYQRRNTAADSPQRYSVSSVSKQKPQKVITSCTPAVQWCAWYISHMYIYILYYMRINIREFRSGVYISHVANFRSKMYCIRAHDSCYYNVIIITRLSGDLRPRIRNGWTACAYRTEFPAKYLDSASGVRVRARARALCGERESSVWNGFIDEERKRESFYFHQWRQKLPKYLPETSRSEAD